MTCTPIKIRSDRHRRAIENRDVALTYFNTLSGWFRASIPKLTKAQVALTRAEKEIGDAVEAANVAEANDGPNTDTSLGELISAALAKADPKETMAPTEFEAFKATFKEPVPPVINTDLPVSMSISDAPGPRIHRPRWT